MGYISKHRSRFVVFSDSEKEEGSPPVEFRVVDPANAEGHSAFSSMPTAEYLPPLWCKMEADGAVQKKVA
ncbi:hypothetical protein U1Q18_010334 [Sarracenia purpurea var. burkii]